MSLYMRLIASTIIYIFAYSLFYGMHKCMNIGCFSLCWYPFFNHAFLDHAWHYSCDTLYLFYGIPAFCYGLTGCRYILHYKR